MTTLQIRTATADDLTTIQRITQAAFAPVAETLGYEPSPLTDNYAEAVAARFALLAEFVLEPAGELALRSTNAVGYAIARPRPAGESGRRGDGAGALYIEALAVSPAAQRRGVGAALLARAEGLASGLSLPRVRLHTDARLVEALRFYAAAGYAPEGPPGPGRGPGPRQLLGKPVRTVLTRPRGRAV